MSCVRQREKTLLHAACAWHYHEAALAYRDKAALLKRDWTDEMFQEGEVLNVRVEPAVHKSSA